jgi:hypothetical protein
MFIESQAMVGAMDQLRLGGIPSLTVHDSLIVPVSKREIAERALREHYLKETTAIPVLKVSDPLPSEPATRITSEDFDTPPSVDLDDGVDDLSASEDEERSGRGDGGDDDPFGLCQNEDDHDPYGLHQDEEGETGENDQAPAGGFVDGGNWPAASAEDREYGVEDAPRNITADGSEGEHDASSYI